MVCKEKSDIDLFKVSHSFCCNVLPSQTHQHHLLPSESPVVCGWWCREWNPLCSWQPLDRTYSFDVWMCCWLQREIQLHSFTCYFCLKEGEMSAGQPWKRKLSPCKHTCFISEPVMLILNAKVGQIWFFLLICDQYCFFFVWQSECDKSEFKFFSFYPYFFSYVVLNLIFQ